METQAYDFIAIGSGPAGQRAAVQAAKLGQKTAIIDRRSHVGGISLHAGTVPSKTLREAVLYFTDIRQRGVYGPERPGEPIALEALVDRVNKVLHFETSIMDEQLRRNKVEVFYGQASLEDGHTVRVVDLEGDLTYRFTAPHVVIATGTKPRWPESIPFDQEVIFDSNFIFSRRNQCRKMPKSLIVVGGGVIGSEYACIFAAMGCKVWVVDTREDILGFMDREICNLLIETMKKDEIIHVLGEEVTAIRRTPEGRGRVEVKSGLALEADAVLFAVGRTPSVDTLGLENTAVELGRHGVIDVDAHFQTAEPGLYAAGDVIGYPALASTSAMQGQMAALHALGRPLPPWPELLPFAIYTIPEVATIGLTEEQLKAQKIPYEKGLAPFRENGRAAIIGMADGALKLLFHRETHQLLGAHIMGDMAAELIHLALLVMDQKGGITAFTENVYNFPTLSELYKTAALNALNRINGCT